MTLNNNVGLTRKKMDGLTIIVLIVCGVITIPLLWWVHCGLESWYVRLGRRFCMTRGFTPSRWRCGPAFDATGVKTESSVVELDCEHPEKGRQLVRLLVWAFGVRKILGIEPFSEEDRDQQSLA